MKKVNLKIHSSGRMFIFLLKYFATLLIVLVLGLAMNANLFAANQVVTDLGDSGTGTLRQAITDVGSGEEITFSVTGTITLTSGQLAISKNLTITGPGAGSLSVSGNNSSRVFYIGSGTVTITGLTIRDGKPDTDEHGGGIYNYAGTLTLENCTVSNNQTTGNGNGGGIRNFDVMTMTNCTVSNNQTTDGWGGGIYTSYSTLTMTNCTVSNNQTTGTGWGGGINNSKTLTMTNCTVSNNPSAEYGGGIKNGDTMTLTNCTISGNQAKTGGGIENSGSGTTTLENCTINDNPVTQYGGGICNHAEMKLTNCTVFQNTITGDPSAGYGGGINNGGLGDTFTLTLTNCTISKNQADTTDGNGGGIYNHDDGSSINIKNTILADNQAGGSGGDFYKEGGTVNNNGYNLVESQSGTDFVDGVNGCIVGEQASLNLSGALEDNNTINGTQTLKTTSGSVAINAGTSAPGGHPVAIPTTDQRGANRNSTTDIGAYEYYDDDGSLPVELSAFNAISEGGKVNLLWRTESEVNNIGFAIYRSEEKDGNYTRIAFVNGTGNTAMPTDYQFTDEKVEEGKTYFYYLEDIDITGEKNRNKIIKVVVPPTKPAQPIPREFCLYQNFPNPFNPDTWIPFDLADHADVSISIYDATGSLVRTFELGNLPAGSYVSKARAIYWNGKNDAGEKVSSGIYFCKLSAGDFSAIRKMVILK